MGMEAQRKHDLWYGIHFGGMEDVSEDLIILNLGSGSFMPLLYHSNMVETGGREERGRGGEGERAERACTYMLESEQTRDLEIKKWRR